MPSKRARFWRPCGGCLNPRTRSRSRHAELPRHLKPCARNWTRPNRPQLQIKPRCPSVSNGRRAFCCAGTVPRMRYTGKGWQGRMNARPSASGASGAMLDGLRVAGYCRPSDVVRVALAESANGGLRASTISWLTPHISAIALLDIFPNSFNAISTHLRLCPETQQGRAGGMQTRKGGFWQGWVLCRVLFKYYLTCTKWGVF